MRIHAFFPAGCIGEAIEDFVPADCAVDDDMTDMDCIFGVVLRHGLRERSKPGLRRVERAIARPAAKRCAGAGKEDRASFLRQQPADGFPAEQKAAKANDTPLSSFSDRRSEIYIWCRRRTPASSRKQSLIPSPSPRDCLSGSTSTAFFRQGAYAWSRRRTTNHSDRQLRSKISISSNGGFVGPVSGPTGLKRRKVGMM